MPVEDPQWQGLDPPQRRLRTLEAVKHLVLWECQRQPVLLIVENLHWIDAETQAVLDTLIRSLPAARLLLITTCRPEEQHSWGNKTCYTQVRLDPLPWGSARALLDALLGHDAMLAPLKQHLIERTEGNPFFLEESVRALHEHDRAIVSGRRALTIVLDTGDLIMLGSQLLRWSLGCFADDFELPNHGALPARGIHKDITTHRNIRFDLLHSLQDMPEI